MLISFFRRVQYAIESRNRRLTFGEIAEITGYSLATVRDYCYRLIGAGYMELDDDKKIGVGCQEDLTIFATIIPKEEAFDYRPELLECHAGAAAFCFASSAAFGSWHTIGSGISTGNTIFARTDSAATIGPTRYTAFFGYSDTPAFGIGRGGHEGFRRSKEVRRLVSENIRKRKQKPGDSEPYDGADLVHDPEVIGGK
ncbi:MAG: helix-turn-helix domain-containing protein [Candidatus Competibacteraceae bacterium]|nr:helix-turn-helix domain-containing protein [Candidatus Competibacteraceae bacterium]